MRTSSQDQSLDSFFTASPKPAATSFSSHSSDVSFSTASSAASSAVSPAVSSSSLSSKLDSGVKPAAVIFSVSEQYFVSRKNYLNYW